MTASFGRTTGEISRARHVVGECLAAWGLAAERDEVELILSELMTNAVRHGEGTIRLRLAATDEVVRIEVVDSGSGRPQPRAVERRGPHIGGWGLRLVEQLTDKWGTTVIDGTTVVWAERTIDRPCP